MSIRMLEKGTFKRVSQNVTAPEIECPCRNSSCTFTIVVSDLFKKFESLREACGNLPLHITSGYRCHQHNKKLEGSAKMSQHMAGCALDILFPLHVDKDAFIAKCKLIFDYVKVYDKHVHVDIRYNE